MAPESVEHKEELEQASLQNEEVKLEAEYQKSLAVLRDNISYKLSSRELKEGRLFDALFNTAEQRNQLEGVYGVQEILQLERELNSLPITDTGDLTDLIMERIAPVLRRYYFDPEVAARAQQIEGTREPSEMFRAGQIDGYISGSPWEFTIGAGIAGEVKVMVADSIMELNWPEQSRWGLQAVKESLKEVAKLLNERPEIKAVVGVSWMMAHNVASAIGFEKFPELPVDAGKRDSIMSMALAGRRDKPYKPGKQPKPTDVMVGAMSREEFLRRFL